MTRYINSSAHLHTIPLRVELKGVGPLIFSSKINDHGWLYHVEVNDEWRDYYVLYVGPVTSNRLPDVKNPLFENVVPVRIDSGCMSGMIFGDKTCECRAQLDEALKLIRKKGVGFVVHIPSQDGRGMGIDFKLRTLNLQRFKKLDTIAAARHASRTSQIDRRTYHGAVASLKLLGLNKKHKINIATNNPEKTHAFESGGLVVTEETRIQIKPTRFTKAHLEAKKKHLHHYL